MTTRLIFLSIVILINSTYCKGQGSNVSLFYPFSYAACLNCNALIYESFKFYDKVFPNSKKYILTPTMKPSERKTYMPRIKNLGKEFTLIENDSLYASIQDKLKSEVYLKGGFVIVTNEQEFVIYFEDKERNEKMKRLK